MKILIRDQNHNDWKMLDSAIYSAETELQELLADSPSLIALGDIRENASPLIVAVREFGLPGSGKTDLLAFSADGGIAVVECKLASNVEIKRKVIAQVLEYGAYLWGMPYKELNERISHRTNQDLAELIGDIVGEPDWDEEGFRANVEDNLSTGAFTLVIAVDAMNDELRRTIQFINSCGNPAFDFTALEMTQFQKEDVEVLVPHLFGVAKPPSATRTGKRKLWTEVDYFAAAEEALDIETVEFMRDLYTWSKGQADRVWFGSGVERGSYTFHYLKDGKTVSVFSVYTTGILTVNFGALSVILPVEMVEEFRSAFADIPACASFATDPRHYPSVSIEEKLLNYPEDVERFKKIVIDLGEKVKELE